MVEHQASHTESLRMSFLLLTGRKVSVRHLTLWLPGTQLLFGERDLCKHMMGEWERKVRRSGALDWFHVFTFQFFFFFFLVKLEHAQARRDLEG